MKSSRSQRGRLARSLRGFGAKFALAFFGFIALILIVLSAVGSDALERGRTALIDAITPALRALNVPMEVVDNAIVWTGNAIYVFRENERLMEENRRLRQWQATAQRLATENERLRALLNAHESKSVPVATARVIGQSAGSYVRAILVNAGTSSGVAPGNVAVDATGVLGRVISSGADTSRVLLLTDLNSRIPVKVLPADVNAILLGDNLDQPQLAFLPGGVKVSTGDWVVTTGHGGIFPPDLPVGRIATVPPKGQPRVALSADLDRLDFVQILQFSPGGQPVGAAHPAKTSPAPDEDTP